MIQKEVFEESLKSPIQFWGHRSPEYICAALGPEVAQMVGYNQRNPHHCYDLFMHTLCMIENLNHDSPILLRVAAFFHDIGKPYVAMEKQGRLVFYGHAKKSAQIAEPILYNLGYNASEIECICFYIRHHDDFISWVLPSEPYDHNNPFLIEITAENISLHIKKTMKTNTFLSSEDTCKVWNYLFDLCRADVLAQSKLVFRKDIVIDSKEHKLAKIDAICNVLNEILLFR